MKRIGQGGWLISFLIPLVVLMGVAILLAPFGETPWQGIVVLFDGAFGTLRRLTESLVKTTPLLFTGLAVSLAFRTGALNIGAEGQFLLGALGAAVVGANTGGLPDWMVLPVVLSAAMVAGGLWGAIAGVLKAWRNVPEVISTIMLNFIAMYWLSALIRGPMRNPAGQLPESAEIVSAAILPRLVGSYRLHVGMVIGVVLAILLYLLIERTVAGYKMRVVGFNPEAARYAGYQPRLIWALSLALSGGIAGLGGGVEVCAITFRVYDNFSPGYGYTAIAVALLARLHPLGVILTAFFFGALQQGAGTLQRDLNVPLVMISIVQGLVVLLALWLGFRRPGEKSAGEETA